MLERRALLKILVLVPVSIIASWLAIGPGGLVSYSPATRIGVNSLFSYWLSITAAIGFILYFKQRARSLMLFNTALVMPIVIHMGGAAQHIANLELSEVTWTIQNTMGDLLELAIISFVMFASCLCFSRRPQVFDSRPVSSSILLIFTPLALFGLFRLFVFPTLSIMLLQIIGYGLAFITVALFTVAIIISIKTRLEGSGFDLGYYVSALLLLAAASASLAFNLMSPDMGWEFAETLQMGSYVLLVLATAVPFLRRVGYGRIGSYGLSLAMILLAYIPLLVTIVIESVFPIGVIEAGNLLAYSIIHIGSGSLAGLTALLLHLYSRERPSSKYTPLILLFITWSIVSIELVLISLFPALGQPTIPNVIGSILTLYFLAVTIFRLQTEDDGKAMSPSGIILRAILIGIALIFGQALDLLILNAGLLPSIGGGILSRAILLTFNLALMFAISYLIFTGAEKSRGKLTIDLYLSGLIAFWIIPNLLESYYGFWNAGWWVSEIILFVGFLAGPPLLAWLYVEMMRESEESSLRARLYADLLMHDVTNFNQMIMTSVELLGSSDLSQEQRTRLAKEGYQAVSLAEQLISNVRLLSESEVLGDVEPESVNLIAVIVQALDMFSKSVGPTDLTVEFTTKPENAYVLASGHLIDIMLNILYSVLQVRSTPKKVVVCVESLSEQDKDYWITSVILPGRWLPRSESPEDESTGLSGGALGLTAAKVITESMGGEFFISTSDNEENQITEVSVKLLAIAS